MRHPAPGPALADGVGMRPRWPPHAGATLSADEAALCLDGGSAARAAGLPSFAASGSSFRKRLIDLALEHEALQCRHDALEAQLCALAAREGRAKGPLKGPPAHGQLQPPRPPPLPPSLDEEETDLGSILRGSGNGSNAAGGASLGSVAQEGPLPRPWSLATSPPLKVEFTSEVEDEAPWVTEAPKAPGAAEASPAAPLRPWASAGGTLAASRAFASEASTRRSQGGQLSRRGTFANLDISAKCKASLQRLGFVEGAGAAREDTHYQATSEDIELDHKVTYLWEEFQKLDTNRTGRLSAAELNCFDEHIRPKNEIDDHRRLEEFEAALKAFNIVRGNEDSASVKFVDFVDMLLNQDLELQVRPEIMSTIYAIREMFILSEATYKICDFTQLKTEDIQTNEGGKSHAIRRLESVSGAVILLNAVLIGVSVDNAPNWPGWDWLELCFTAFFVGEFCTKVYSWGFRWHFLGDEWHWNTFDFVVVVLAVFGVLAALPGTSVNDGIGDLTIMRLMRLARITRLLRLLRLRVFKELTLIVNGVIAGMRTLLWAMLLLVACIYCIGVLLAQTIGTGDAVCDTGRSDDCTVQEQKFEAERGRLFEGVGRSMFTVFRCLTEDCTMPDGSPLMMYLWYIYGWPVVIIYFVVLLFVCFGLFNLIMANFVESTMENARFDEQKRHILRRQEHIHVARKLQKLMLNLYGKRNGDIVKATELQMQIDRETFQSFVSMPDVNRLLDDLDVATSNRKDLFDILDANRSGSLDASEIIAGLMKVRGPADKSDTVAALLGVRAMHENLRNFEKVVLANLKGIWAILAEVGQAEGISMAPYHPPMQPSFAEEEAPFHGGGH